MKGKARVEQVSCELEQKYDITTLSETWLSHKEKTSDYYISGYQKPFCKDRETGTEGYGRIMAHVSDNIAFKRMKNLEYNLIEGMWLQISVLNEVFSLSTLQGWV